MVDYTAYLLAQRRVVEVAHGARPENLVRLPELASDPVQPRAFARLQFAAGELLHRLADALPGSRGLTPPTRPTVGAIAAASASPGGSPAPDQGAALRLTASLAGHHGRQPIASRSVA
jgi:hypothetical protein